MSIEGQSTRHNDNSVAGKIASIAAADLVASIKNRSASERELCCDAEVDRRTWRRASGRPYPSDRGGVSMLTLRDFVAMAKALHLDPARLLQAAIDKATTEQSR